MEPNRRMPRRRRRPGPILLVADVTDNLTYEGADSFGLRNRVQNRHRPHPPECTRRVFPHQLDGRVLASYHSFPLYVTAHG
jgi:hypothetical protein